MEGLLWRGYLCVGDDGLSKEVGVKISGGKVMGFFVYMFQVIVLTVFTKANPF